MAMPKNDQPHQALWNNLGEVLRLLQIHTELVGDKPGYKHNVEVLNKSGIVLLVACWEAFVEDLAETAFGILLRRAASHNDISSKVLAQAGKLLLQTGNDLEVWQLAGDGWKAVLQRYKKNITERYIGKLNTPKPEQVDEIYRCLFGIQNISTTWHWTGMNAKNAVEKLTALVALRGSISHRVAASRKVHKDLVRDYNDFINHLAVATSNAIREHIMKLTNSEPWDYFTYNANA